MEQPGLAPAWDRRRSDLSTEQKNERPYTTSAVGLSLSLCDLPLLKGDWPVVIAVIAVGMM